MRRSIVWLAVAFLGLSAAGCGGGSQESGSAGDNQGGVTVTSASTATTAAAAPGQPTTVKIDAGDYFFRSSLTTFKVGVPYHFEVTNVGNVEHEFMVIRPIPAGTMEMEQMDEMAVGHIEEDDLKAGATESVDVTFDKPYPPGTLELACHIGTHYQKGMKLAIVVEE
ncbi:MAG TPA: hypothetical protein VFA46_12575 [Actinomycetes bacterium]|jgi:uncharacterized cupredoxin-like copper-binding protein|nr:hypothetical protein [Actinomycetes bacterium]